MTVYDEKNHKRKITISSLAKAAKSSERLSKITYVLSLVAVLLCISCSFQHPAFNKTSSGNSKVISADPISIAQTLSLAADKMKAKTAVYTLENGGSSLISRLWFFEHAKKTIDIQYYSFAKDVTGLIASDYVIRAADRGVKIRILIDDAACRMYSHEIQLLDSHENIDVRVYNAGLMLGRLDRRILKLAKNYTRLLRRMHNKAVIFDDQIAISGGRNVADEYFDYDDRYNFRDRDLLMMGKAVNEVTQSFDKFWTNTLTVPYSELSSEGKKDKYTDPARFDKLHQEAINKQPQQMRDKIKTFPASIKTALASGELLWMDSVTFISDIPGKNEHKENREGGICTDSLLRLFSQAKTSIDIQSPYFITTAESQQLIRETIQRGIKIRLLTNSLASTDNHEAFSGYQKDRKTILEDGVQVYEFKPDAKVRFKLMDPDVQAALNYKPVYGLHSKTIIIDKYITIIGSYNFDPRSANYNTECFTVIRSTKVAQNVLKYIEEEFLPENAWKVTVECNPDKEAKIKKRIKVVSRKVIPKKIL